MVDLPARDGAVTVAPAGFRIAYARYGDRLVPGMPNPPAMDQINLWKAQRRVEVKEIPDGNRTLICVKKLSRGRGT
ncbi:hypothetical protein AA21952_1230 [Acetobacter oeni LMG 21952]|nr:hypothetical protein AA21952_1230 [Acetobacter oeni LMG 21952]